jgi:VCBS repeat-containing protein
LPTPRTRQECALSTWLAGALLLTVVTLLLPTIVAAQQPPTTSLLVKLVPGLSIAEQAAVVTRNGGIEVSSIPALRIHVILVTVEEAAAATDRYRADPQVQHVEANRVRISESIPSDPLYASQWALPKIGWDQVFGAVTPVGTATVAILDTGVDAHHPELAGKVVPGISILDGTNGTTDPAGHGTWLAGIIAANTNTIPVEGIAGVAYAGVQVMPVTVLDSHGEGLDSDVIAGVLWAADHGANVILMAFSNPGFSQNLQDAIDYAWSQGAVVVAAVGNNASSDPTFPAGDRGVMGVAATDQSDNLASFSNDGKSVFIAAPGVDIQTIDLGDAYNVISGTSTSAAIVAGAAALMKAVDPTLTNGIIVGRLARNADPAGTTDQTGNGRVFLPRALADTSTDFVQPAGVPPVGDGGPLVGPYRAAGNATINGTVTSSIGGAGILGATVQCTASTGCNGTFTATTGAGGTYSLQVSFAGNGATTVTLTVSATNFVSQTRAVNIPGNQATVNNVNISLTPKRTTSTTWSPTSATVAAGGTQVFTITVADTNSGQKSAPTGTVSFTSSAGDGFAPNPCTLTPGANSSTCSVTVTASATSGAHTLTANYGGSAIHATSSGTAILTPNTAPVANNDSFTTNEDTPLNVASPGVLGNDTDANGDTLTAALVTGPSRAVSFTLNANGSFAYTPAANFNGTDTFTYRANDGTANSNVATVTITVTAVNDAPTAAAQSVTTDEDTAKIIALGGSDIDNISLTFSIVAGPTHGSLTGPGTASCSTVANGTGTPGANCTANVTYTPNPNYNGSDSFTFRVNDGALDSTAASVSITVTAVNDAPTAAAQSVTTDEDTAKIISLGGSDIDSPSLTFSIVAGPTHGSLTGPGPASCSSVANGTGTPGSNCTASVTYTPNANYNGSDSFTFSVNDGALNSTSSTVSITVTAVNDAPTASSQAVSTNEDTAKPITLSGADIDSPSLTFSIVVGPTRGALGAISAPACSPVTNGTGTSGSTCTASVTYTPNANANGSDSFTFKVNDGALDSSVATVSITVNPQNDKPTAAATPASLSVNEDTGATVQLSGTDTETADAALTFTITAAPIHGTLTNGATTLATGSTLVGSPKTVTYTPAGDFHGSDSFKFKVTDTGDGVSAALDSDEVTVPITVNAVNDKPIAAATPASLTLNEDTSGTVELSGTDVETAAAALTFTITAAPAHGVLKNGATTLAAGSTFVGSPTTVTYTPAANFNGSDSFKFKVTDTGDGASPALDSDEVTVAITIAPVDDAPVARNDVYTLYAGTTLTVGAPGVLGNDFDIDSSLTVEVTMPPARGSVALNPDGSFTYTPPPDPGVYSFKYKVREVDGWLESSEVTVTLNVLAGNANPVAVNDVYSVFQDTPLAFDVRLNDLERFGAALTAVAVSLPAYGTLTPQPDGSFVYTPASGYTGPDTFTYTVTNGTLVSNLAMVTISVLPTGTTLIARNDVATTAEDTTAFGATVLGNDDGSPTAAALVTAPLHAASFTFNPDGTFQYEPAPNYFGPDSFTYRDATASQFSNVAMVTLTVTAVNDPPVAESQSVTTKEETAKQITLRAADIDSSSLTFSVATAPAHGSLGAISAPSCVADDQGSMCTATVTYTPAADYFGPDSFTFKAKDATAYSAAASVSITVQPVNDPPTFDAIADQTVNEDAPLQTVSITGVAAGPANESTQTVTFTATSSDTTIVPNPTITGTGATRSLSYQPVADANGEVTITVTARDDGGTDYGGNDTFIRTFKITVRPVNDPPTLDMIANQVVNEDAPPQNVPITGVSAGPANESGQTVTVTAMSSNTAIVPHPVVSGSGPTRTLTYQPAANANGVVTITVTAKDNGGTAYGGVDTAMRMFTITVNAVNDPPSFAKGADQTVLEDAGPQTVTGWATNISAGPANESTQTVSFLVSNNNSALFSAQPAISGNGTLTYTPAPDANGQATVTVRAQDDGGTAYGGVDTSAPQYFTITVTAVNDAPSFTKGADQTVKEDYGSQTVPNWATAISAGPPDEATQLLTFIVTNDNNALFSVQPAIDASGTLTYTPAPNANGFATVTVQIHDNGGTANRGVDTSVAQTFKITVTEVNDEPTAATKSFSTAEDMALTITAAQILAGASAGPANESGQVLTVVAVTQAAHGTVVLNADQSITYTPAPEYNGPDSFTYTIRDNGTTNGVEDFKTAIATISMTVTEVNDPPVAADDSVTTAEDTPLVFDAANLLANDSKGPANESSQILTVTAVTATGNTHGMVSLAGGRVYYTPALNYNGPASFRYTVCDNGTTNGNPDPQCAYGNVFVSVTSVNDAPTVQAAPTTQLVQYSDAIAPVVFTAGDVDSAGTTLTATTSWKLSSAASWTAGLPAGLTLAETSTATNGRSWTVSGNAFVAPATYLVRVTVTDDFGAAGFADATIDVKPEDARATYTGAMLVWTTSASSGQAVVPLRATIQDITAVTGDPATDSNPGDIRNAVVRFFNRDTNATLSNCDNLPIALLSGDPKVGTAACNWAADIGNGDSLQYTVGIEVKGYYARNDVADVGVVTVSKPLPNFITGGGYLVMNGSAGQIAGAPGSKTNFGFNVKYNRNLTNQQGQANIIVRSNGRVYQIKSNATDTLGVLANPDNTGKAEFTAKANITDVTNPANPVSMGGNFSLRLSLTDKGEPGTADTIAISVYAANGTLWYSSSWTGAATLEQLLGGGNLSVH